MHIKCANCKNEITTTSEATPEEEEALLVKDGWVKQPDGTWTGCAASLAGCANPPPPPEE